MTHPETWEPHRQHQGLGDRPGAGAPLGPSKGRSPAHTVVSDFQLSDL